MNTHTHFKIIDYCIVLLISFLEVFLFQWTVNSGLSVILSYFNINFQGISYWFALVLLFAIHTFTVFVSGNNQMIEAARNIKEVENELDKQISVPELANTYMAIKKILLEFFTTVTFILLVNIIL